VNFKKKLKKKIKIKNKIETPSKSGTRHCWNGSERFGRSFLGVVL
jgi:hypothetical protein